MSIITAAVLETKCCSQWLLFISLYFLVGLRETELAAAIKMNQYLHLLADIYK